MLLEYPLDVLKIILFVYLRPFELIPLRFVSKRFAYWEELKEKQRPCYFTQKVVCLYAEYGYLSLLKWWHRNDFKWDYNDYTTKLIMTKCATKNGHIEFVRWLVENLQFSAVLVCDYAARQGNLALINWTLERFGTPLKNVAENSMVGAIRGGHLTLVKWIEENSAASFHQNCCTDVYFRSAARAGAVDVLEWLYKKWPNAHEEMLTRDRMLAEMFGAAAKRGHTNVLDFLLGKYPFLVIITLQDQDFLRFYDEVCELAVRFGRINVLEWELLNGYPPQTFEDTGYEERSLTLLAVKDGQLETLKWLSDNGIKVNYKECLAKAKDPKIYDWLVEQQQKTNEH